MVSSRVRFSVWWQRSGMWLRAGISVAGIAVFALLVYLQGAQDESPTPAGHVVVFSLVNFLIVILFVLLFLIGRNVTKLVFERKKGTLGAKLRTKLVAAFLGLTLIPTLLVFILASGLLNRAMEGWFSDEVASVAEGSVEIAKHHVQFVMDSMKRRAIEMAAGFESRAELGGKGSDKYFENIRQTEKLFSIRILNGREGKSIVSVESAAAVVESFKEPPLDKGAIESAVSGTPYVVLEESGENRFVRAYVPIKGRSPYVLVISERLSDELSGALSIVADSYRAFEQFRLFSNPLESQYVLTFIVITCLVVFGAIWIGFFIARQIVVPIQRLAEGTRAIARGNLDFMLRERGDDELAFLVRSFNTMVADLKTSRKEAERRRVLIEAILSRLAVGVIGVDESRRITSINGAARRLLGIDGDVHGSVLSSLLNSKTAEEISALLEDAGSKGASEKEVLVSTEGREFKLLCTAGRILGDVPGLLLLLDDITDLSRAQAMAAWREVAQRIAHEIKNPLTPIQLSAQRLQKLVKAHGAGGSQDSSTLIECAETIVENVEAIKHLANEFTHFARMPTAEFQPVDLNALVSGVVGVYAANNSKIIFQFIADDALPTLIGDKGQLKAVLVNLLENAVGAVEGSGSDGEPKIVVRSFYAEAEETAGFEVTDNGPGVAPSDRNRIFEPYYTTKSSGTGLGLAIVNSIVSDHQGHVRVYDVKPRGARFRIELPLDPKSVTQRRILDG